MYYKYKYKYKYKKKYKYKYNRWNRTDLNKQIEISAIISYQLIKSGPVWSQRSVFLYSRSPPYSSSVSSEKAAEVWLISSLVYYNFLLTLRPPLSMVGSTKIYYMATHFPLLFHIFPDIKIIHQMMVWGCITTLNSFLSALQQNIYCWMAARFVLDHEQKIYLNWRAGKSGSQSAFITSQSNTPCHCQLTLHVNQFSPILDKTDVNLTQHGQNCLFGKA